VIVETPDPLKSKKVTPNPTLPPDVLIPTPEITPVSAEPSIAGRAPVRFDAARDPLKDPAVIMPAVI